MVNVAVIRIFDIVNKEFFSKVAITILQIDLTNCSRL